MSQQINLFNPVFLKQKKYFSAIALAQGLGLILLGALLLAGYLQLQSRGLERSAAASAEQLAQAQAQLAGVMKSAAPRQKNAMLAAEVGKAESEVKSLRQAAAILQGDGLRGSGGYAEHFRAFARQSVPGLWLTGLSISGAGHDIEIRGKALRPDLVPVYLGRLKHEATLQGKSFATLDMRSATAEQGAEKQRMAADMVEFRLQSAGIANENAETAGAKGK